MTDTTSQPSDAITTTSVTATVTDSDSDVALRARLVHVMHALRAEAHDTPAHSGEQRRAALNEAANAIQIALGDGACRCVPHNGKGMLADPDSTLWCIHGTPDPAYRERTGRTARPIPAWVAPR